MLAVPKTTDLDETITQLLHCADFEISVGLESTFWLLLLERLKNNWGRWARMPSLSERMVGAFAPFFASAATAQLLGRRALGAFSTGPAQLPDLFIQPKGLLATEAFVTFPMLGRRGGALSLRSHFFNPWCSRWAATGMRLAGPQL